METHKNSIQTKQSNKRVFCSGCFDLLHPGHIQFLNNAAQYGELYVSIGSDANILELKHHKPLFNQKERQFMLENIKSVHNVIVGTGSGKLDFKTEIHAIKPHYFIVNSDGHSKLKQEFIESIGVEYIILEREPHPLLDPLSSTSLKIKLTNNQSKKKLANTENKNTWPFRIALAGGWVDQAWVSKHFNPTFTLQTCSNPDIKSLFQKISYLKYKLIPVNSMVTVSIHPTIEFNRRSGIATSTRQKGIEFWPRFPFQSGPIPMKEYKKIAQLLFYADNPPGATHISGSQDAIGLIYPGINQLIYNPGSYWPEKIQNIDYCSTKIKAIQSWLESVLWLIPLEPRFEGYDPLVVKNLDSEWITTLGITGTLCFHAIQSRNINLLGWSFNTTIECWRKILPNTVPDLVFEKLSKYDSFPGRMTSGCGGGYIIVASSVKPDPQAFQISIRM